MLSMIHTTTHLERLTLRRWKHLFQAGLLIPNPCLKVMFFPPGQRPGKLIVPPCRSVPVIDLEKTETCDRAETIQKVLEASQEYRFFQVHTVLRSNLSDKYSLLLNFSGFI